MSAIIIIIHNFATYCVTREHIMERTENIKDAPYINLSCFRYK